MVKNITAIFIAALLGCSSYTLQAVKNQQELFLQAGKLYQKQAWQEAYDQYQSLDDKGPAVWYNMGNCAYHLGNKARAVLCWERAKNGASSALCLDCATNCDTVYRECNSIQMQTWRHYFYDGYVKFFWPFPTLLLQCLFLLLWVLFLYYVFFKNYGFNINGLGLRLALSRTQIIYVAVALLMFFSPIIMIRYYQYSVGRAVVMIKQAPLFVGPHEQYDVLEAMDYAHVVTMSDHRPGWYKVQYRNKTGWAPASSVEKV